MADKTTPFILVQVKGSHSFEKSLEYVKAIDSLAAIKNYPKWIAAPHSFLAPFKKEFENTENTLGSRGMLSVTEDSFTGSIADKILSLEGVKFVTIGSLAERKLHPEECGSYSSKIIKAKASGIIPILCVGETSPQNETISLKEEIKNQIKEATSTLSQEELKGLYIAYEAPWINLTPWESENAILNEAYLSFEEAIKESFDSKIADSIHLIYSIPLSSLDLSKTLSKYSSKAAGFSIGIASDCNTSTVL